MNTPSSTHNHAITNPDTTGYVEDQDVSPMLAEWCPTGPGTSAYVPVIVDAALRRCQTARARAAALPYRTDLDNAVRAERLAVLADRRARWWEVLARWVYSPAGTVPLVFGDAAVNAAMGQRDDARFWRESAADWRARAEQRPTSDAAGALSNHHELGIAS